MASPTFCMRVAFHALTAAACSSLLRCWGPGKLLKRCWDSGKVRTLQRRSQNSRLPTDVMIGRPSTTCATKAGWRSSPRQTQQEAAKWRKQRPHTLTLLDIRCLSASSAQCCTRFQSNGGWVSTTSAPASTFRRSRSTFASMGFSTAQSDKEAGKCPCSRIADAASSRSKLSCNHLMGTTGPAEFFMGKSGQEQDKDGGVKQPGQQKAVANRMPAYAPACPWQLSCRVAS